MNSIESNFPVSDEEYQYLSQKFGKLLFFASHQLKKQNSQNNFIDDVEDISQELQLSILRAGSYHKRQNYIEKCLLMVKTKTNDKFLGCIVEELEKLWSNRTRHGAGRQKFGPHQEQLLNKLVNKLIPKKSRPDPKEPLKIDTKFSNYCKSILWNSCKAMGRKITSFKKIRNGMVSLNEHPTIL